MRTGDAWVAALRTPLGDLLKTEKVEYEVMVEQVIYTHIYIYI